MSPDDFKVRILIQRGKYKEAEAMLRTRLAQDPDASDLHLMLAQVLFQLNRPKEAEKAARTAIGLDPEFGYPHEVLAQILMGSSNLKGAEEAVMQANALDGDCSSRRAIRARIALERKRFQLCLDHAQAGLEIDPDDDSCRFFRGIALGHLGRHDEAEQEVLGLLRDDPEDSTNHSARGWTLLERNSTQEAKMHFQEALRLDPENEDARAGFARCMQQGNPVVGWLLRAIIAMGRIPTFKLMLLAIFASVVIPRFLQNSSLPVGFAVVGKVIGTGTMAFFYLVVAAGPLFSALLFSSREGRNAIGSYELRGVKWSVLPLLAGVVYLVLWIAGGGRWVPFKAIGLLCAATLLYEGFSIRHPWVRRRMLMMAGLACGCAIWFLLGDVWLLQPMALELKNQLVDLAKKNDPENLAEDIKLLVLQFVRIKNWAFGYPALAIYMLTSFSENLIAVLTRRAPDDAD